MITFKPVDFRESVWPETPTWPDKEINPSSLALEVPPSPKRLLVVSLSAHRWWGTGRVMALWVLKLQTVDRRKGFTGFWSTSLTQQTGNEFFY